MTTHVHAGQAEPQGFTVKNATRATAKKLPQITAMFWALKIACTTLGETGGDEIAQTLNVGYLASFFMFIALFVVAVTAQLRADRLHPALYWTVIAATSTAGTTLSDFIDRSAGLGYFNGSLILITCLGMIFFVWSRTNETFSVERIQTLRGEGLYWSAILCSNTLGTAFGDWLSDSSGLHFWGAAALIAGVMLLILLAHYFTEISTTLLFWMAFVLTRPLGASVGDLFWKPHAKGGMALGSGKASVALLAIIAGLIAYSTWQQRREEPERRTRGPSREPVGVGER